MYNTKLATKRKGYNTQNNIKFTGKIHKQIHKMKHYKREKKFSNVDPLKISTGFCLSRHRPFALITFYIQQYTKTFLPTDVFADREQSASAQSLSMMFGETLADVSVRLDRFAPHLLIHKEAHYTNGI